MHVKVRYRLKQITFEFETLEQMILFLKDLWQIGEVKDKLIKAIEDDVKRIAEN